MRWVLFSLLFLLLTSLAAAAAGPPRGQDDALALAARIDARIASRWPRAGFQAAPVADDAEFLRRAHLDVAGVIPRAFEVRDFLDDPAPDKRRRLVDRLLASPEHARHFANVWRLFLLEDTDNPERLSAGDLEAWLARHVRVGSGYDQIVRELLTAPASEQRRSRKGPGAIDASPLLFYRLRGNRVEDLAASTARLFLGAGLGCAQCHDHPFASWKRTQFWQYAAFFKEVRPGRNAVVDARSIAIPGTSRRVFARFPDDSAPQWQPGDQPLAVLARWVVAGDNPYFARAAVNRLWAEFFGAPLVEDLDQGNGPSGALIYDMAREFARHRFDVRFLIRAITSSRAYQRSSRLTHPGQKDPGLWARRRVRGMSPEQLTASIARAAGQRRRNGPTAPALEQFRARFADARSRAGSETTLLQALQAMNGRFIADAVSLERGEALAVVADARGLDAAGRVEQLFLATLSRRPRSAERDRLAGYVRSGGPRNDPRAALADVFWALLNSAEFMLNH
jgi:hypothetical protein